MYRNLISLLINLIDGSFLVNTLFYFLKHLVIKKIPETTFPYEDIFRNFDQML
jgi:hypothetical protein